MMCSLETYVLGARPAIASYEHNSALSFVVGQLLNQSLLLRIHSNERIMLCTESFKFSLLLIDHGLQFHLLALAHFRLRTHTIAKPDGPKLFGFNHLAPAFHYGYKVCDKFIELLRLGKKLVAFFMQST
mmetsp:Transcript_19130/g.40521  ORF Transcript_19130/g.40521 Transcript_19130/m.40521 type:complete len:129 (-) Transcript_19130:547-933(-)